MTAIIETNLESIVTLDLYAHNFKYNSGLGSYSTIKLKNSQSFHSQNYFSVIIKQTHCPYDLLFTLNTTPLITLVKIHLLKSNGNLLKISSQQSKTYLIRKFHQFNDLYTPRVDPSTGAIYFDLDYFELKPPGNTIAETDLKILYDNLNHQKLYLSIKKFSLFCQDAQQQSLGNTDFQARRKYQQLSKIICVVNDSDLLQFQSNNQHTNLESDFKNPYKINQKQLISHLENFYSSEKYSPEPCNKLQISKQIKQIEFEASKLSALTKRKQGKSNYETLLVNHATQKQIKEVIMKMAENKALRTSIKVVDSEMGKITLNIEKQEETVYQAKMRFLSYLTKNTEYYFIDKYFKNHDSTSVLISLSLKQESVHRFLLTNAICISLETKMRILLQVCSAVNALWEEKNIIFNVKNLKKIHITKNLTIKLRNLANFCKIDSHMMLEEKSDVNLRLLDNWLNLSELYFNLFYGYNIGFMRPAAYSQSGLNLTECIKSMTMSKRAVGEKLVPEGFKDPTKQMLVGLNYIFLSFVHKAGKMYVDPNFRRHASKQACMNGKLALEKQNENEATKRLLGYKLMCCWLFKNFQMLSSESL